MIPKSMDSPDAVEIVMVFEEIFETDLPVNGAESSWRSNRSYGLA